LRIRSRRSFSCRRPFRCPSPQASKRLPRPASLEQLLDLRDEQGDCWRDGRRGWLFECRWSSRLVWS
jgi:hypothetical protein